MKVITLHNRKGGVGKTTLTSLIGAGLAMKGHRVLMLDADGQGNLTTSMGLQKSGNFYDFCKRTTDFKKLVERVPQGNCPGRLFMVTGNEETWGIPASTLMQELARHIANRFAMMSRLFHYVIIDTQPSKTMLHDVIALITDYVLIPTDCEMLSALDAVESTVAHLNESRALSLQSGRDKGRIMAIVPNRYRVNTGLHESIYESLVEDYGDLVWQPIPLRSAIAEAQFKQTTLMHDAPALDTNNYLWALINRVEAITMEAVRE